MHYNALMDESTAALALAIGGRVRQERQARRWTLNQLAEAAGVSRRMVVNVEQGIANGLLEIHEDLIRLSAEGRLLANEVLVAFLPEAGTGQDGAPLRELATAR